MVGAVVQHQPIAVVARLHGDERHRVALAAGDEQVAVRAGRGRGRGAAAREGGGEHDEAEGGARHQSVTIGAQLRALSLPEGS